jgi:hypothetical protein
MHHGGDNVSNCSPRISLDNLMGCVRRNSGVRAYAPELQFFRRRAGAEGAGTEGYQPQLLKIERQSNAAACGRSIESHYGQGQ